MSIDGSSSSDGGSSGPFYTQLGAAESVAALRSLMEERTGFHGNAIRFEKIIFTGVEGKTSQGCPIAKWIIRRSSLQEKVLCLIKKRAGHFCSASWIIVVSVAWEGLALADSDYLYSELVYKLNESGVATNRRCAANEQRTCACQGLDPDTCGVSYSFGCSWSMFFNGCKYARSSKNLRKFRLSDESQETDMEDKLQRFATAIAPLYKRMAPEAYANQVEFEAEAIDCRLGLSAGRPFAGITACFDFCAHSHRDTHDMSSGCTVVTTLTRHRGFHKPLDDEQLHVLPHYVLAADDECGSVANQLDKVRRGAVQVLDKFPCVMRRRSEPLNSSVKQKRPSKAEAIPAAAIPDALVQSNHITSSTLRCVHHPRSILDDPSTSLEMKIRALQAGSQSSKPLPVVNFFVNPQKPAFNRWAAPASGGSWQPFPYYRPPHNALSQWWKQNASGSAGAPLQAFEPVNPSRSFPHLNPEALRRPSVTIQATNNEENFRDSSIGGVALALTHGSVLFECARHELHATTALRNPNRKNPTRISLVLYQHRNMNEPKHGYSAHEKKMQLKKIEEEEAKRNAPPPPPVAPPPPQVAPPPPPPQPTLSYPDAYRGYNHQYLPSGNRTFSYHIHPEGYP